MPSLLRRFQAVASPASGLDPHVENPGPYDYPSNTMPSLSLEAERSSRPLARFARDMIPPYNIHNVLTGKLDIKSS